MDHHFWLRPPDRLDERLFVEAVDNRRLAAEPLHLLGVPRRAGRRDDVVSSGDQLRDELLADRSGSSRDENLHRAFSFHRSFNKSASRRSDFALDRPAIARVTGVAQTVAERRLEPLEAEGDPGAAAGRFREHVGAARPAAALCRRRLLGRRLRRSPATTSMSSQSAGPGFFSRMRALAPTPAAGPESSQSTRKWSVNRWWLASTSRKSNTSSRGWRTVTVAVTGFIRPPISLL